MLPVVIQTVTDCDNRPVYHSVTVLSNMGRWRVLLYMLPVVIQTVTGLYTVYTDLLSQSVSV